MELQSKTEIKTVAIIGLGALGILFGHHLSKRIPRENLRIIANQNRINRYKKDNLYCNDELCNFHYVSPEEKMEPADLLIFTVKYGGLSEAIREVKNQVGEGTIILSALNGISSETIIGETYGIDKLLYCVAQGMDAVKETNRLSYHHMGMLVFGEKEKDYISPNVQAVASFFEIMHFPYQVDSDMKRRMWGKFMLNVGVNQTVAVNEGDYGTVLREGPARETMIAAMREVIMLSEREGVFLNEEDLVYWLKVLGTLNCEGKPSMRQDLEAGRLSEVELFSGTVLDIGRKYGLATPVNQELYDGIHRLEAKFLQ